MRNSSPLLRLFVALFIFLFVTPQSKLLAAQGSSDNGKTLFETKCSPCHTIGGGTKLGPDLKEVTEQRPRDWLVNFISDPEKMFEAGDPIAADLLSKFGGIKMPNLGLSKQEISEVLSYIGPQQPTAGVSPTRGQVTFAGDPSMGEKLFVGDNPLQKGGPPCLSCHNLSGIPFPGGGTLGPDLTAAYSKFGADTMNSMLATLPFPTMTPIFNQRPLTQQEQHDLGAFLQKVSARSPKYLTSIIILSAIAGSVVLMILIWRIWHKRLLTVRRSMVEEAARRGGRP